MALEDLFSANLCRICAFESDENEPLYQDPTESSTLTDSGLMFATCFSIELSPNEGLPTTICFRCNTQLRMFSEFRKGALYMNSKFQEKLKKHLHLASNNIIPIDVKKEAELIVVQEESPEILLEEESLLDILGSSSESISEENFAAEASIETLEEQNAIVEDAEPEELLEHAEDCPTEVDRWDISLKEENKSEESPAGSVADVEEEEMDVIYLEEHFLDEEYVLADSSSQQDDDAVPIAISRKRKARENPILELDSSDYVVCDKCFKRVKISVKNHVCATDQVFHCKICGTEFVTKQRRDMHQARHTNERPIGCDLCDKFFKNKYDLKVHMRSHGDTRSHICEICGRAFRASTHLSNHIQSHASENLFECDHCNQRYKTRITLLRHITSMHTQKDEFKCEICGKNFGLKFRYQRHMKIHERDSKGIDIQDD